MEKQKQYNLTMDEYIESTIVKQISVMKNKYNFGQDVFEDIYQETYMKFYQKLNKNETLKEFFEYVKENINKKEKENLDEYRQKVSYISLALVNDVSKITLSELGMFQPKYELSEETGKWEHKKRDEIYKQETISYDEISTDISFKEDLNKEIDLKMFYLEIQKYTNILICLLNKEEINELLNLNKSNYKTKTKFVKMFINLINNIEEDRKGFDDEEIRYFWQDVLEEIGKDKESGKENKEKFLNTKLFKVFKNIIMND